MLYYDALTRLDRDFIRMLFGDFANEVSGPKSQKRDLLNTRLRLTRFLCTLVDRYRVVEGVTKALPLTLDNLDEEDIDMVEGLLMLYKYKYVNFGEREGSRDERLFLNIVYRRFDNLVLKYY